MTPSDAREPAVEAVAIWLADRCSYERMHWATLRPEIQARYREMATDLLEWLPPAPASASARALREAAHKVVESFYASEKQDWQVNEREADRAWLKACRDIAALAKLLDDTAEAALASAAPEQAGEFAPRGLVAQYKLTAAEAACAELWAYIASLRAPIGLLASYQPTMDEMLAMRGELGDLIARVKRAADKPVPQNPGAALLGEFARGVEAAAKVCDEYADRMERSYKARADAGTPSYTAECKADAGQTLATKIRALARAPETQTSSARAKEDT